MGGERYFSTDNQHYLSKDIAPMESTKKTTKKTDLAALPVCFCGQAVKVNEVKKDGENKGKTFYVCGCKIYNPETKQSFGGCTFFSFKGDTVPYCTSCQLPMRMFKNSLSSAKCVNPECKLKQPNVTPEEIQTVYRIIGGDACTCGHPVKIFKRGDGCSVVCGYQGKEKCSFRVGLDFKTEQIYFQSK